MTGRIINDITSFIFVSDKPQKADIIFLPGGSFPEIPEKALIVCKSFHARRCLILYQIAFPEVEFFVFPVDCYGITKDNWHTFEYGIDRVLGELARCGNQFVGEIKEYVK